MSRRFEEADNRPVFVGNLDPYTTQREIERLFDRKGRIKRVEMKTGFAFVFYEDHRDARDAVKDYDGYEFGPSRRRLRVELARGDGLIKRREDDRRTEARNNPCETLFVVNFDPTKTRTKDLEKLFEEYGTLIRVEIKKNFAFVQFQTTEEATAAMRALDGHYVADRQITVEFMARGSMKRSRSRTPSPRRSPPRRRRSLSRSPRSPPSPRGRSRSRSR